ncbi:MAG: hypothetical protein JWP41_4080, partial [Ramlibacter sp.]|nr:hypothetical protein [Ramlibacter sp.]
IGMKIADVRYMHKLSRALISMQSEWAKLLLAGGIGWLIAYSTAGGR